MYKYKIVKENPKTGGRSKKIRTIKSEKPLQIGRLYEFGVGYKGTYRVMELLEEE